MCRKRSTVVHRHAGRSRAAVALRLVFSSFLCVVSVAPSRADVIFSNLNGVQVFDPFTYVSYSIDHDDPSQTPPNSEVALSFTPSSRYRLETVRMPLVLWHGTPALNLVLAKDDNGKPGNGIETIQYGGPFAELYKPTPLATFVSSARPTLDAGIRYWLVLTAPGPAATTIGALVSPLQETAESQLFRSSDLGGQWTCIVPCFNSQRIAFEIAGALAGLASPVINSFGATPSTITSGQPSTLSWTTANASSVAINGVAGTLSPNGSISVTPTETTTYTLTATGQAGQASATATVTVLPSTGAITHLHFIFRNARQRAVGLRPSSDIIFLIKRSAGERFIEPVAASLNGQPFTQKSVVNDVLTLSGTPGGIALDDWFANGNTARASIKNGDGSQFAVMLRRSATSLAVVTPEMASLSSETVTPAATITISGQGFSPVAAENEVILILPDGRSFRVPTKSASATALEIGRASCR